MQFKTSLARRLKTLIIGDARSPNDRTIFHKLSLIAFFAWIGLGADGLSSSCYGPEEAFRALREYPSLSIFVALGSVLTLFILVSVTVLKFHEGRWITFLVTGTLAGIAIVIKGHYYKTGRLLSKLDNLVQVADYSGSKPIPDKTQEFDPTAKTAVLLVSGFNGRELHTLFSVFRTFEKTFKNFIFVQVGVVDAGNFKGFSEIENLKTQIKNDLDRYINFVQRNGYYAEGLYAIGVDVVDEIVQITLKILERFPSPVFFGGQLIFPNESFLSRMLHNYTVFAVQRRLYNKGIPVVIMPIRV